MNYEEKMKDHYKRTLRMGGGDGGFSQIICPSTYDKPCRLCTSCYEILKDRSNQGTKLREKAYSLNQKHRYYSNVIFPGVNPSQVAVLEYGDKIFGKLIGFQMDPNSDYKDWTHPVEGRNIFIKKIPGATKDKTSYDVIPRANRSKLMDMNVLGKLYQLDEVLSLIKSGDIKPVYQSKLEMGDTETRVLPSWLGPGSNVFYFPVNFHYGVTEEEFNAIQAGDLNTFVTIIPSEKPTVELTGFPPVPVITTERIIEPSGWESLLNQAKESTTILKTGKDNIIYQEVSEEKEKEASLYPGCYGQYDPSEEECKSICVEEGWAKSCQTLTAELIAKKSKRTIAKRLSK